VAQIASEPTAAAHSSMGRSGSAGGAGAEGVGGGSLATVTFPSALTAVALHTVDICVGGGGMVGG